jgi:ribonuclease BN (tRNA processing enzyme)
VASTEIRFLGSGDAFGHGGRLQACILLTAGDERLLIDCGATSLFAMDRAGIDPNGIDAVAVSHFHGDHFGGIPYLILDGQFRRRSRPLVISGPSGIAERVRGQLESAFPGSSRTKQHFPILYREIGKSETEIGPAAISALSVDHTPGANAIGLRVRVADTTIAYSGDTAWTNSLVALAEGTDLFVCEAYSFEKQIPYHLSYRVLNEHRELLSAKRIYLTHLGPEMLERRDDVRDKVADDGTVIEL